MSCDLHNLTSLKVPVKSGIPAFVYAPVVKACTTYTILLILRRHNPDDKKTADIFSFTFSGGWPCLYVFYL